MIRNPITLSGTGMSGRIVRILTIATVCFAGSMAGDDARAGLATRWRALDAGTLGGGTGILAPPTYGLRLDGFFDSGTAAGNKEVTFHFVDVYFDEFNDGTAKLHGTIEVAEYDNSGGVPANLASTWALDIDFRGASGSDPNYRYYVIDVDYNSGMPGLLGSQPEMVKTGGASPIPGGHEADLWSFPTNLSKPFQVGVGANQKNSNMGATGWLGFKHGGLTRQSPSSDILIDLTPVPEPSTVAMLATGVVPAVVFWSRRRGRRQGAPDRG